MYLTKFPLNMTRRETRNMIASPYRMHAAISGSFPSGQVATDEGRVLWRIDRHTSGGADLYIVSVEVPSLVGLDEQVGWPDLPHQWSTKSYDGFLSQITEGQTYQFRLVANPVVSRKGIPNSSGRSKRVPYVTILQTMSWLVGLDAYKDADGEPPSFLTRQSQSRAETNGFTVVRDSESGFLQLRVSESREVSIQKRGNSGASKLMMARYDGILEIQDADLVRCALTHGIGHAKGFGCGLLTLSSLKG